MTLTVFLFILTAAVCHALWDFAVRKVTGIVLITAGLVLVKIGGAGDSGRRDAAFPKHRQATQAIHGR